MSAEKRYALEIAKRAMVIALTVLAGIVLNGLLKGQTVWGWIVAYWTVLTLKNGIDWLMMK